MRAARNKPPAAALPGRERAAGEAVWTLKLRTLTPIYKGGADPGGIDEGRPFRGPAIRGLLRFWWRATVDEVEIGALRERERALFGGIFGEGVDQVASRVRVGVLSSSSTPWTKSQFCKKSDPLSYVLWVCRQEGQRCFHKRGARATLRVSCPESDREEVERALRAWVRIGGIGSRSRRGLGAFFVENDPWRPPGSAGELAADIAALAPSGGGRAWPTLAGARVLTGPLRSDAMGAWREAVKGMQAVRSRDPHATGPHPCPALAADWKRLIAGTRSIVSANAALGLPLPYQSGPHHKPKRRFTLEVAGRGGGARFPSPVQVSVVPVGRDYLPVMVALTVRDRPDFVVKERGNQSGRIDPEGLDLFCEAVGGLEGWTLHSSGS